MIRKKILVVEDGELNRDLLFQLLEEDYALVAAGDGEEALAKARTERPDLILMDLGLPVLDGWEATKRLKADRHLRHIPVIAITSHAMMGEERRARLAGCDDFLSKPIDETQLMEKVRRITTPAQGTRDPWDGPSSS